MGRPQKQAARHALQSHASRALDQAGAWQRDLGGWVRPAAVPRVHVSVWDPGAGLEPGGQSLGTQAGPGRCPSLLHGAPGRQGPGGGKFPGVYPQPAAPVRAWTPRLPVSKEKAQKRLLPGWEVRGPRGGCRGVAPQAAIWLPPPVPGRRQGLPGQAECGASAAGLRAGRPPTTHAPHAGGGQGRRGGRDRTSGG